MAQGDRTARVAELIHREAARVLLEGASDELLRGLTITGVRVSRDLRNATILYTTAGGRRAEIERRARRFEPFLQRELARRLHLRYAVRLRLAYDDGMEHAMRLEQLFAEINRTEETPPTCGRAECGRSEDGGGGEPREAEV